MISILLAVAAVSTAPYLGFFPSLLQAAEEQEALTAAGFCWELKFSGNEMH